MKVPAFLNNKYVLYTLIFIGILNVLGYVALEDYNSTALFIVVILLSNYFSSNQSLNILVAILVTSLVAINNRFREGFKEGKEAVAPTPKKPTPSAPPTNPPTQTTVQTAPPPVAPVAPPATAAKLGKDETCKVDGDCSSKNCTNEKKCGFKNNVPPSSPASVNSDEPGTEMDVAASMEDAYTNLNKMMGDGGMKSMASETKKLVAQQKDLMTTLHSMTPALNSAKETLKNLNLPDMEQMTNILKKFNQ